MAVSPAFTVRGGEYDTKMYHIRIDSASGIVTDIIAVGSYQPRCRNTRNRTDLPLRPKASGNYATLQTCQDVSPSSRSSAVSPLGRVTSIYTTVAQIRAQYGRRIIFASSLILG